MWDKFNTLINLDLLPYEPGSSNLLQSNVLGVSTKSVLISTQKELASLKSHSVSRSFPPLMYISLALFLQVLPVKGKEPHLNEAKVLQKPQQQLFPPPSLILVSQQDIEEVLITITPTMSPNDRCHGQPVDLPRLLSCFYFGNKNHDSKSCSGNFATSFAMTTDIV